MLKRLCVTLVLTLPIATVACSKKPVDERAIGMMEELGNIAAANENNCDAMAAKFSTYLSSAEVTSTKKELAARKASAKSQEEAEREGAKAIEKYKDRIGAAMTKLQGASEKCKKDAKVLEALKGLDE